MKIEVTFPKKNIVAEPTGGGGMPASVEAFPVGAVFISVNATNPAELLGYGTWQSFGAGKVLTGYDAGDEDFDADLKTGGNKKVASQGIVSQPTFTGNPLPGHQHPSASAGIPSGAIGPIQGSTSESKEAERATKTPVIVIARDHTHPSPTFTGSPMAAHTHAGSSAGTPSGTVSQPAYLGNLSSVVQPYVVVRFWQRVA